MPRYLWSGESRRSLVLPTLRMRRDLEDSGYVVWVHDVNKVGYREDMSAPVAYYKKPSLFKRPRVLIWPRDDTTKKEFKRIAQRHTPDVMELPEDTPDTAWHEVQESFDRIYEALVKQPDATWNEILRVLGLYYIKTFDIGGSSVFFSNETDK